MNYELKMLGVLLHPGVFSGIVPVCHSSEGRVHMAQEHHDAEQDGAILTFLAISMVTELPVCGYSERRCFVFHEDICVV